MIRAIVFDFDGVLADSEPLHLLAYQEVLAGLGVTLSREEYYAAPIWDSMMRECLPRLPKRTDGIDAVETHRPHRWRKDASSIRSSSERTCSTPARRPASTVSREYSLGIASGALRPEIDAILRRARLDRSLPVHRCIR